MIKTTHHTQLLAPCWWMLLSLPHCTKSSMTQGHAPAHVRTRTHEHTRTHTETRRSTDKHTNTHPQHRSLKSRATRWLQTPAAASTCPLGSTSCAFPTYVSPSNTNNTTHLHELQPVRQIGELASQQQRPQRHSTLEICPPSSHNITSTRTKVLLASRLGIIERKDINFLELDR